MHSRKLARHPETVFRPTPEQRSAGLHRLLRASRSTSVPHKPDPKAIRFGMRDAVLHGGVSSREVLVHPNDPPPSGRIESGLWISRAVSAAPALRRARRGGKSPRQRAHVVGCTTGTGTYGARHRHCVLFLRSRTYQLNFALPYRVRVRSVALLKPNCSTDHVGTAAIADSN